MLILVTLIIVNSEKTLDSKVSSVTNSNNTENIELNNNKRKVTEKITNSTDNKKKSDVLNYKDVFKEPKPLQSSVDKIVEREKLKALDVEVNDLVSEADALIEKENLTLKVEPISEEKKKEQENKIHALAENLDNIDKY